LHIELLFSSIEARLDAYGLAIGKFERVFYQIYKYLFEAQVITDELLRQRGQFIVQLFISWQNHIGTIELLDCLENEWRIHHLCLLLEKIGHEPENVFRIK